MGYFKNISLKNFRNFKACELEFSNKCNVFFGKNGSGKTSILEAMSLFAKGRGIKKDRLINMINIGQDKFVIKSNFQQSDILYKIKCETLEKNQRIKSPIQRNYQW